jgi:lipid II:glycine glycyltransferase (peptidoglycan interpeptide bridge formation enzyme)
MLIEGLGAITELGKVVYVDLTGTIESQRAKYNRRLKTYLNKSRKSCTVIEGNLEDHLDIFINLYNENMKRVDADDHYFFDREYYHKILSSEEFESELKLCVHNESQTIIGGSIFLKKGNIVQYHLSAYCEDNFGVHPIKLIIDEMRIKATQEGFKYLNLGGGLGSMKDSLFRFKSGFSKDIKVFKIWKHIVDEDAYKMLVKNHFKSHMEVDVQNIEFFPAYRANIEVMS